MACFWSDLGGRLSRRKSAPSGVVFIDIKRPVNVGDAPKRGQRKTPRSLSRAGFEGYCAVAIETQVSAISSKILSAACALSSFSSLPNI